jgi:hypothetical protein
MLERGFSLMDTPPFIDDGLFRWLKRSKTVLPFHSRRWWKYPQLARYGCWLERLLSEALPEESVSLTALEFRHESAGSTDQEVDRLHADGSYIRSVFTRYGPTTVYRDCDAELPVPHGQTLLMTALDRARAIHVPCTLHRRPGAGSERAVIVCSFEPRHGELDRANVVRLVAETNRPRGSYSKGNRPRPRDQDGALDLYSRGPAATAPGSRPGDRRFESCREHSLTESSRIRVAGPLC